MELITPHGDRKLVPALVQGVSDALRLITPSWGSETSPTLTNGHPAMALITPHGDRKTMKRCTVSRNSLPLRGSDFRSCRRTPRW